MLSNLTASLPPSAIVTVFNRAIELRAQGRDLIDFSIGEPDFDTPEHICDAGLGAIRDGITRYTATDGTTNLKDAVRRKFARDNALDFSCEEIIVSSGAKPLLATAVQAVINPGDEVVIPTPAWTSHLGMVAVAGGRLKLVKTDMTTGFKMSAQQLQDAITSKTRLLLLCSPSNPTGAVYSGQELAELAEVLRQHPNILVISDDLYEHIVFDDITFATLASVAPDLAMRILTVNGVSKAYAMTGWRIGYAGGPKWWADGIRAIFSQTNGGPCSISQIAATAALDGPQELLAQRCKTYQQRRDFALERLEKIPTLKVAKPEGAFYLMPECSNLIGRQRALDGGISIIETSTDLADYFLDCGIVVVPGTGFSCDPYFRLSIATSDTLIEEGLNRLAEACEALQ